MGGGVLTFKVVKDKFDITTFLDIMLKILYLNFKGLC